MTDPKRTKSAAGGAPPSPGPLFEASSPLATVLAWPALPAVLRRALSRALPREAVASLTLGESVQAWRDPALREWIVALLALDVGVGFGGSDGYNDSMIGLFAHDELDAEVSRFFFGGVHAGQGLGAASSADAPGAPPAVCAAAFVYRDAKGELEADFVFLAGATREPVVQVELAWVDGRPFDEQHIEHALAAIAAQVEPAHEAAARTAVRGALLECLAALGEQPATP
ncbi:MAG: hypothetical protein Q8S73_23765 [Deltaproteobacteria bacterium]|nr:hypothetical protein [Myxococcales bacterium]MDP3217149.1 hypothetical protein [Deltaproteobacteria bacterium]